MIFTITGKHIEITEAIRAHAQDKADKLPRFHNHIHRVEVLVESGEGGKFFVEIITHVDHEELVLAKEIGTEMYTALDAAFHKTERQLKKIKEKQRGHKHPAGPLPKTLEGPEQEYVA